MMEKKTGASTTTWIKIDLQGADSAHYKHIKQRQTRRITFPDGVDRLITMERRLWDAYDTVEREWGITHQREQRVFDLVSAVQPPGHPHFERLLQYGFARHVEKGWRVYNEKQRTIANTR